MLHRERLQIYLNLFLVYETPFYRAKLEVQYVTTDTLASNCIVGFEKMIALYNTTIAQSITDKCRDLKPGRFVITSFSITASSFKVSNCIDIFKNILKYIKMYEFFTLIYNTFMLGN